MTWTCASGCSRVGRGERVALKGEDAGLHEYSVGKMELLPQTENIFLVYKEGWHNPESSAQNPSLERTWTKKDALVSFKNPKKDIIVYLEADTNAKAFDQPPVLTVAVGGKSGLVRPHRELRGLPEEDPRQGRRPRRPRSGWTCASR